MKQLALTLTLFAAVALGQRVAPGVNPGHYQQQPQQQYQPPPPQYNQPPPSPQQQQHYQQQQQQPPQYQQQQVPVQPQYQQVPVQQQQQQPHGGGHAPHHGQPQQVLNANIQNEKAHIAEHMDVPIDTSKMSEQELQFHYFKMHDSDNNNKLDGCELIKSLIHWHEESKNQEQTGQPGHQDKIFSNDELSALIDPILSSDDHNQDGFIDYPEFVRAQHKAATQEQAPQQ
ncbi:multiple coagulation factor deficiency protein 2 homolog isoform X3 [Ochlerotatus camptorhynchus]|uniref:multiple coagulation factor deficiency protein 2 homolog isoform X3 n=1 Tax=Ochlerotatus camptorhynchus TaxID=644619 RepID=UPI0031D2F651